jgi:hypothetical protein
MSIDMNEISHLNQLALFAMAGLAGYLTVRGLPFPRLKIAGVLLGLLSCVALVGAFTVVHVSDGSAASGFGLAALFLLGFSLFAGTFLASRLTDGEKRRRGRSDDR